MVLMHLVSLTVHIQIWGSKADNRHHCLGVWKLLKLDPNIVFLVLETALFADCMNGSDSPIKESLKASKQSCVHPYSDVTNAHSSLTIDQTQLQGIKMCSFNYHNKPTG